MLDILLWGAVTGLIHFCVIGAIYGNPFEPWILPV
jgi:hypothetical protein